MTRPRFTIARWMTIVLIVALGLAVLRNISKKKNRTANLTGRFALVGQIDVNFDDRDDRAEIRRMIEEAGGVIDFDFPPPDVGKATGQLLPRIDWYVCDDRMSCPGTNQLETRRDRFNHRVAQIIRQARLKGIRAMPIHRLLTILGRRLQATTMP